MTANIFRLTTANAAFFKRKKSKNRTHKVLMTMLNKLGEQLRWIIDVYEPDRVYILLSSWTSISELLNSLSSLRMAAWEKTWKKQHFSWSGFIPLQQRTTKEGRIFVPFNIPDNHNKQPCWNRVASSLLLHYFLSFTGPGNSLGQTQHSTLSRVCMTFPGFLLDTESARNANPLRVDHSKGQCC